MVSFFKKLFGGKEQVVTSPVDQAAQAAGSAASNIGSVPLSDPGAQIQQQASGATAQVDNLRNLAGTAMGGGLPDIAEIQGAVDKLPENELSSVVSGALASLPADTRSQLGGLLSKLPGQSGASGIAAGDSGALGGALSSMLKSEGGLGNLAGLFGGGATGAAGGGGGGGFGDVVSDLTGGGSGGGFDFAALMSNPLAKTVLAALIPAILKAVQGK